MEALLLAGHIAAGTVAIVGAFGAIASKSANVSHRLHVVSGLTFVGAMAVVVVTALALVAVRSNAIMLLISLFSAYFVWAGFRYARNRRGVAARPDRAVAWAALVLSVGMLLWGLAAIGQGELGGIVVVVFGVVGIMAAREDLSLLGAGGVRGRRRIELHLGRMLGATIATVTAVMVTNVVMQPPWLPWLLPTFVLLPVIVWWERRLRRGARPRGMPVSAGADV